jgi:hypothetical protein
MKRSCVTRAGHDNGTVSLQEHQAASHKVVPETTDAWQGAPPVIRMLWAQPEVL